MLNPSDQRNRSGKTNTTTKPTVASKKSFRERYNMGKLRPQIFLAIVVLGILAGIGAMNGVPELATATIGGIIALGMKVLENE